MPERANQMSPTEAYNMAGSRWSVPFKVLSNKKALDQAFQQHAWNMQRDAAQQSAGGGKRGSNLDYQVLTQAVELARSQTIDMQTPEGQQAFQQIYQALLNQATGGERGAMMMAGGEAPPVQPEGQPQGSFISGFQKGLVKPFKDAMSVFSGDKTLTREVVRQLKKQSGGDKEKSKAMARELGYRIE